eukprot:Sspe_Gene.3277::Locus_1074_Transcript_1_1_Confidence_1.000_Length_2808::g.3277::m.3277/K14454/GOT1; aspartate aminotransferase, cytoplasmic
MAASNEKEVLLKKVAELQQQLTSRGSQAGEVAQLQEEIKVLKQALSSGGSVTGGTWRRSWADQLPEAPPDSIFGLAQKYREDPAKDKVDLVVGAYRTEEGHPYLLQSVSKAEKMLAHEASRKEYAPIGGLPDFCEASAALVLGTDSPALAEGRVAKCQSLSGTGALALAAAFFSRFLPIQTQVLLSKPTWANHRQIFDFMGFRNFVDYRYWDDNKCGFDFEGMVADLLNAPARSIVVLHLCAHNPTGIDPTLDQWRTIGKVCWERRHHVIFDSAYQGYASGDLVRDAWPARLFERDIGLEFVLTQSYSKNMGLYGERIGCFSYVCKTAMSAAAIEEQIKVIARRLYSNPPAHGARIVLAILSNPELRAEWQAELKTMAGRIVQMRHALKNKLIELDTPGNWQHIVDQIGMFSFTGLSKAQCEIVTKKHHVYMLANGRISMAGLSSRNVETVARAFYDAIMTSPGARKQEPAPKSDIVNRPEPFRLPSPLGQWTQLPMPVSDEIFGVHEQYQADHNPDKVNLVLVADGRTIDSRPTLLPSVIEAEKRLADAGMNKEYSPLDGTAEYRALSAALILGHDSPALKEGRVATCQSLSGTGGLSLAAYFYSRFLPITTSVVFSSPTWSNHRPIFEFVGFRNFIYHRYWDDKTKGLDFEGMIADLKAAPARSIVVLQLCAHNPTGVDPTPEQWKEIGRVCWDRRHHVVLDAAYQGYATGDLERDAYPARLFEREIGLEFAIIQSYSKPLGLYNERIGCFSYVTKSSRAARAIQSQVKVIVRRLYSNPPLHGARIIVTILSDPKLKTMWEKELKAMSRKHQRLRGSLVAELESLGTPGNWEHISQQIGMFSYVPLTPQQIKLLRVRHHVYMLLSGRLSVPGLTSRNIAYVGAAIDDVVRHPDLTEAERAKLNEKTTPRILASRT